MKMPMDMDTVQIEITNACIHSCSNCTRFCGHHSHPYFMSFEKFKQAVDSMEGFPNMTGFMGGEPLLHPQFEKFCEYALSKIPRKQLGLWSCFPEGYEKYRDVIVNTFGNIFLNDQSRTDIFHCPILVAAEDMIPKKERIFLMAEHCWLQNAWSASINPRGAFFCEVAAAMAILFDMDKGWKVEKEWWLRTPKDFKEQIEEYCPKCGCAMPLIRRSSIDGRDDISPSNLKRLKGKSKKIDQGKYVMSDCLPHLEFEQQKMAAYKDMDFRNQIAARYGIYLMLNDKGFLEPVLRQSFVPNEKKKIFEIFKEKYL